jgi:hypothetical protein
MAICSAANPNPVVVIAAFTRQITGVVIGLPVVDGLCAHDGPMRCVKGISGCWRASIFVLLWTRFANIDKRENNNGRQQSPQYFHGLSFAQRCLKVLISLFAVSTEIRALQCGAGSAAKSQCGRAWRHGIIRPTKRAGLPTLPAQHQGR